MVTPAGMPVRRSIESPELALACLKSLGSSLARIPVLVFCPLVLVAAMYSA